MSLHVNMPITMHICFKGLVMIVFMPIFSANQDAANNVLNLSAIPIWKCTRVTVFSNLIRFAFYAFYTFIYTQTKYDDTDATVITKPLHFGLLCKQPS